MATYERHERTSVSYNKKGIGVRVDVVVSCDRAHLTKEEQQAAVTALASRIMLSLSDCRHVNAPLSKIKVR